MSASQNKWVPRKKEEGPKTIKQIQQEVKQVKQEREQPQLQKEQKSMKGRGAGRLADPGAICGRLDQNSSCDNDGNRKHRKSSSAMSSKENRRRRTKNASGTGQKEPVIFLDEERLSKGDQKFFSKITGKHLKKKKDLLLLYFFMGCFTTFFPLQLSTRTAQTRRIHRKRPRMKVQEPYQRPSIIWSFSWRENKCRTGMKKNCSWNWKDSCRRERIIKRQKTGSRWPMMKPETCM